MSEVTGRNRLPQFLSVAEVDECASVNATVGNFDFERAVSIDRYRYRLVLVA